MFKYIKSHCVSFPELSLATVSYYNGTLNSCCLILPVRFPYFTVGDLRPCRMIVYVAVISQCVTYQEP